MVKLMISALMPTRSSDNLDGFRSELWFVSTVLPRLAAWALLPLPVVQVRLKELQAKGPVRGVLPLVLVQLEFDGVWLDGLERCRVAEARECLEVGSAEGGVLLLK